MNAISTSKDSYFKIKDSRTDYCGQRYFRYNMEADKVVQVCCYAGDIKKGKSNTIGIYLIGRMTFLSNYLSTSYVEPCSQSEYKKQFDKTMQILQL